MNAIKGAVLHPTTAHTVLALVAGVSSVALDTGIVSGKGILTITANSNAKFYIRFGAVSTMDAAVASWSQKLHVDFQSVQILITPAERYFRLLSAGGENCTWNFRQIE